MMHVMYVLKADGRRKARNACKGQPNQGQEEINHHSQHLLCCKFRPSCTTSLLGAPSNTDWIGAHGMAPTPPMHLHLFHHPKAPQSTWRLTISTYSGTMSASTQQDPLTIPMPSSFNMHYRDTTNQPASWKVTSTQNKQEMGFHNPGTPHMPLVSPRDSTVTKNTMITKNAWLENIHTTDLLGGALLEETQKQYM